DGGDVGARVRAARLDGRAGAVPARRALGVVGAANFNRAVAVLVLAARSDVGHDAGHTNAERAAGAGAAGLACRRAALLQARNRRHRRMNAPPAEWVDG